MDRNQDDREQTRTGGEQPDETSRGRQAGMSAGAHADVEASETDGKGTGGMGEDLGGYDALPESDATG